MRNGLAFSRSSAIQTRMFEPSFEVEKQDVGVRVYSGQAKAYSSRLNPLIPLSAHDAIRAPGSEIRCHSPFFFSPLRRYEPFNSNTGIPFREFVTLSLFADRIRPDRRAAFVSFHLTGRSRHEGRYPRTLFFSFSLCARNCRLTLWCIGGSYPAGVSIEPLYYEEKSSRLGF